MKNLVKIGSYVCSSIKDYDLEIRKFLDSKKIEYRIEFEKFSIDNKDCNLMLLDLKIDINKRLLDLVSIYNFINSKDYCLKDFKLDLDNIKDYLYFDKNLNCYSLEINF